MSKNLWFTDFNVRGRSPYLLICFPFSGAGANIFRTWANELDNANLLAVQLPGRERRIMENPIDDLDSLVNELADALEPRLDRPYLLFGHSMGALIAYRLALAMEAKPMKAARHLIVSAYRSPEVPNRNRSLHNLSDPEFIDELKKYGGTPEEILQHEESMDLLLPMLRADFRMHETYRHGDEPPLDCPISAFAGESDSLVPMADMALWSSKTVGGFDLKRFKGGHFFLQESRSELLAAIQDRINQHLLEDILSRQGVKP